MADSTRMAMSGHCSLIVLAASRPSVSCDGGIRMSVSTKAG
jgi:hypothetical protein